MTGQKKTGKSKSAGKKSASKMGAPAKQAKVKAAAPAPLPDDAPAIALDLAPAPLDADTTAYFDKCREKIGFVPNVLQAYAFDLPKLKAFAGMYNDLMLAPSGLSKLEREMIAVAVSSVNRCYYCLTAHGAAVRQLSGDPVLGEQMVMNYRAARLDGRQRAILDFAVKLTERPHEVEEADRTALRKAGLSERDIWDVAAVTGFFNMSNRIASATDMRPNLPYHGQARGPAA
ncbi:MAG: peroxidase-related enzyme [Pseudomonadota bacterium]